MKLNRIWRLERALSLVWESARGWTIVSVVLFVIQGMLPLLTLYLMKLLIDAVAIGISAPDKGDVFKQVVFIIGTAGIVALVGVVCRSLAVLVNEAQAHVVSNHMYDILHAKSIEVDLEYYESSNYYDTLYRAQVEAPSRPTSIVNGLVQVGQGGISLLAMAGLMFTFHWSIAVVMFFTVAPGVLARMRYARRIYSWQRDRTSTERKSEYFSSMLTGGSYAKEIRLFELGPLFRSRFRDLRKKLLQEKLRLSRKYAVVELNTQSFATIAMYGTYAFIAYRAVQGAITIGDFVMYYQAFQRGQGYLKQMLSALAGLYQDNLFLSNLYEFLDLKPKVVSPLHPKPVPKPMQAGVVLDHVSFKYPDSARKVLDDINLTIRPGEHVALVGENGAGKTTLIKLLCRLYDPTYGTINFDGMDLRQFEIAALRRQISVIFQDYVKYHLPARENIWFGNINSPPDQKHIEDAAKQSGADRVIAGLKHGYETILGKMFAEGEELSIGEWQKVALARAFLRESQIIVLDEPTSSLDAKAEYEVFKQFHNLAAGRTAILISHRLSTVRMADRIYVLENGRIVESGSHDNLVLHNGRYAHLFETQAQYYR